MNKIIYDIELLPIQQSEIICDYYYQYTKQIKNKKDLAKLGLYCAKYCFEYNNETTKPLAQKCIDLIESWLINPIAVIRQKLINLVVNIFAFGDNPACIVSNVAAYVAVNIDYAVGYINYWTVYYSSCSLYYCSQIPNININLPNQYLQTLLRTTKQFNTDNSYSKHVKQIVKQDIDKLELVDYNMLLDISNEYYNIDIQEFNYDNIFSRRNLIEMIRREYE